MAALESGAPLPGTATPNVRYRAGLALAASLLLASCVSNGNSSGGPGPVLSFGCERHFQNYLQERSPAYFATDVTGRACAYVYCPVDMYDCYAGYPGDAIRLCEQRSGVDCYVYAVGRNRSWQGPGLLKANR